MTLSQGLFTEQDYWNAAMRFARAQPWGKSVQKLTAIRVTGIAGKSGCFQCYRPYGDRSMTSVGEQFHVGEFGGRLIARY